MGMRFPGAVRRAGGLAGAFFLLAGSVAGQAPGDVPEEIPDLTVREELRFRVIDPTRTNFPDVSVIAEGPEGSLYLGFPHLRLIRAFDSAGAFVQEFGSAGMGPSEMGSLAHMGWIADTLYVADATFHRFVFFGPDGRPRGEVRRDAAPGAVGAPRPPAPHRLLPDGSALFRSRSADEDAPGVVLLRGQRDGSELDTLLFVPESGEPGRVVLKVGERSAGWEHLYVHRPLHAVAPDGQSVATLAQAPAESPTEGAYTLTRITWEGDTVFHRAYGYEPVAVDREMVWRGLAVAFAPLLEVDAEAAEVEVRAQVSLPRFAPPVTGLALADDGTVWVRVWSTPGSADRWVAKDPRGEPSGRIELPAGAEVVRADGEAIYVTQPGEDGLTLVRYRLDGGRP